MSAAKRSLGQNFLRNPRTICRIIEFGRIKPGEPLLEIGPGKGALTSHLLQSSDDLIAVELDADLARQSLVPLFEKFPRARLYIEDIRSFDPRKIPHFGTRKLFGNLPYYVATHLLIEFAEPQWRQFFSEMIVMVQKEVAERIGAKTGSKEYGYLTCICQLAYQVEKGFTVSPDAFSPRPKVDSMVLRLVPRVPRLDEEAFWNLLKEVLKQAFGQRRKTIQNNLKGTRFASALAEAEISPRARAEEIPPEDYLRLAQILAANERA
ncbi:MAG TPA: 16S rRNA (adenine(1518)-N(6)/adenine(1519)-N(6))-dimethyltransferase RsmA [Acidobacteriota bacterium]|jgi:16S rRNA (adenine1518-N6/adenine1519-N6)-dimethyltransferase